MQALWMLLGAFFFAAMAVCVKIASAWFNSAELVCYRGLISMLLIWGLARQQRVALATRYPAMHAWRSLVGVVSLGAWFYAIAGLPLATAMTLNYMSSIWIAAFLLGGALIVWNPAAGPGALLRQGPLTLSVLVGFAGVVLTLQPTMSPGQLFAGLAGLLSGLTAALAYLQVMALGKLGEPATRVVFYFAVGSAVAVMPLARIRAMPTQPERGMSSPNSSRPNSAPNTMPLYCRQATTRVAPRLKARVMHSWPSVASRPTGSSHRACGHCQGEAPTTAMPSAPATAEPTAK